MCLNINCAKRINDAMTAADRQIYNINALTAVGKRREGDIEKAENEVDTQRLQIKRLEGKLRSAKTSVTLLEGKLAAKPDRAGGSKSHGNNAKRNDSRRDYKRREAVTTFAVAYEREHKDLKFDGAVVDISGLVCGGHASAYIHNMAFQRL